MKFDRFNAIYDQVKSGKTTISELKNFKVLCAEFVKYITDEQTRITDSYIPVIEKFLKLCNDYYVFSEDGDVLITDRQYDEVTNVYKKLSGNTQVIYTDSLNLTRWNERRHISPNMVGSLEKVYDLREMYDRMMNDYGKVRRCILSPKFDGCSVVITFDKKHNIVAALTRKDGVYGQDLTPLITEAEKSNRLDFVRKKIAYFKGDFVDVKCEILVHSSDYEKLCSEKKYKNRRAAASAISANPSNIKYSKYLSFMPLVAWDRRGDEGHKVLLYENTMEIFYGWNSKGAPSLESAVEDYRNSIRNDPILSGYRMDGIVFTFDSDQPMDYSKDIMCDSLAYKFNTQMSETVIQYGYLSIGRTGKATPMIKVAPCEVNETEVTDVSLSNFKKCNKLNLHEGDHVIIESAGDVIPMVKEVTKRYMDKPNLSFSDRCPHCNHILKVVPKFNQNTGVSSNDFDLYCANPNCNRRISGRLSNFLDKLGAKGISDGVLSSVVELTGINEYWQLFELTTGSLAQYEGWGVQSESELLAELHRIQETSRPYSQFLGAIGIPMVSTEKCKELMRNINFDKLVFAAVKHPDDCIEMIMSVDGFGSTLANNICNYVAENYDEIERTSSMLNLYQDQIVFSKGNVVMSGFRDENLKQDIESLGFAYSDNFNKDTVAVISTTADSGKAKKAIKKGIPLYAVYEADELLQNLRNL